MTFRIVCLFFSVFFFSACTSQTVRNPAMIGGSIIRYPSVVFLNPLCSGTMIAPHVVLMAGHCVLSLNEQRIVKPWLGKGDQVLVQSFDGPPEKIKRSYIVHVSEAIPYPTWEKAIRSATSADATADLPEVSDLGVVILDENLPIVPATLPEPNFWNQVPNGTVGMMVFGAGCQQRGSSYSIGTMKGALYTEIEKQPFKIEVKNPTDVITNAPAGPCKADSGGGAFQWRSETTLDDPGTLVGVASVMTGTEAQAFAAAPTGFLLARVDRPEVLSWLRAVIAKKAPSRTAKNLDP